MDATCFAISINDMILDRSCGDMKVGASCVKSLHNPKTIKYLLLCYDIVYCIQLTI